LRQKNEQELSMPAELKLTPTWNLDPLPSTNQPSLAYLLLDITESKESSAARLAGAPGEAASSSHQHPTPSTQPLNLSLVLDTSGSMGGAKLQNLKQAVRWVVDHLSPQDTIAITHFDDEVHPLIPSTRKSEAGDVLDRVDAIREAGGTAMSKGLLVGLDEASKGRSSEAVSRIILLTDGQTWGDADRCRELAAQAGSQGIPITALGVGAEEDWSIELLDDIATESGGLSGYIAKPEEISSAFEGTVLAMQQTVARNLRLTVNPAGGVAVRTVYRVAPIISRLWPGASSGPAAVQAEPQTDGAATSLTVPLGDIQGEGGQTILIEILLPPRRPGQYRLARLLLQYELTGGANPQADVALDLVASFAQGVRPGPGNPRVMNSVEKATTFKLQTRALQASMAGDVTGATRNLRAAATRLLNMGEIELAQAAENEARLLESRGQMSPAGTKKLAFDTRKLAVAEMEEAVSDQPSAISSQLSAISSQPSAMGDQEPPASDEESPGSDQEPPASDEQPDMADQTGEVNEERPAL
jgi:Ca-activated chloride channel homolog